MMVKKLKKEFIDLGNTICEDSSEIDFAMSELVGIAKLNKNKSEIDGLMSEAFIGEIREMKEAIKSYRTKIENYLTALEE